MRSDSFSTMHRCDGKRYDANSSSSAFASFRSSVSNPSVNHPYTGASSSRDCLHLALVAPEACEAHGGAELPGFGLLLARDLQCTLEIRLRLYHIRLWRLPRDFTSHAMNLSLAPPFLRCFDRGRRFADAAPSIVELFKSRVGSSQA
jgi:hypothetical protein